jgi:hypothetical protein
MDKTYGDKTGIRDSHVALLESRRDVRDRAGIRGHGIAVLRTPSLFVPGKMIIAQQVEFENLVTQIGDQYYGERAAGVTSPPNQVTGMRLGIGTTAVAKTGAGAAIVTYTTGSNVAISGGYPQSAIPGTARRIIWQSLWGAGVATVSGLAEVVITNETPLTNVAGTAANTISRALLSPVVNKGANDTLTITWNHDLLGA